MSRAGLQHLPELARECTRIGVTLVMSHRHEEAEAAFRKAVKLDALKAAQYHGWTRCTLLESGRWIRGHLMPSRRPIGSDLE
jgi:hypothetical protein